MIKVDLPKIEEAPKDWPEVFSYHEDVKALETALARFKGKKHLILIGNGGSITSYDAYLGALGSSVASHTLWTMEPDEVFSVKKQCPVEETVVVAVSKSGQTLGLIETLLAFLDYKVICVTEEKPSPLSEMAKRKSWTIVPHPPIGGRFSGATASAFVPAILAGLDVAGIQAGFLAGYQRRNEASSVAKYFFELESKGYSEIYLPIYSARLAGFQNLIIQLMHESVCKDEQGQTVYAALAPEAQHHTNQRFLGGKKNVVGCFVVVREAERAQMISLPEEFKEIDYKGSKLAVLDGLGYQEALRAEYLGTKGDADAKGVPNLTLEIDKVTAQSVGELVSFWHLVAYYSCLLRAVDPFDQPAVEESKDITMKVILNKG